MNKREEYLDGVCREVRFRAAHKYLRRELSAHIDDKKAALEAGGITDAEAEAVRAMGNPAETGRALNAIHRPRAEWGVIVCVLALTVMGVAALYVGSSYGPFDDPSRIFWDNFSWRPLALSLAAMLFIMLIDYTWLAKLRYTFFGVGLAYLIIYIAYSLIDPHGYGYPWLGYGWLGPTAAIIIPTVLFILSITGFLQRHSRWRAGDIALLAIMLIASIFALRLMSALYAMLLSAVYCAITVTALASGSLSRKRLWLSITISVVLFAFIFLVSRELLPGNAYAGLENSGNTFQVQRMLKGAQLIGPSPIFIQHGSGPLSASTTGSILAAAIGAYGWLFGIVIIGVFGTLLTLMIIRSMKVAHLYGRLLAVGICTYFATRYILFVMINLGLFGNLSVHLPFVSFGTFNLLTDSLLTGVFLSVWRRSSFMPRDAVLGAAAPVVPAPPIQ